MSLLQHFTIEYLLPQNTSSVAFPHLCLGKDLDGPNQLQDKAVNSPECDKKVLITVTRNAIDKNELSHSPF